MLNSRQLGGVIGSAVLTVGMVGAAGAAQAAPTPGGASAVTTAVTEKLLTRAEVTATGPASRENVRVTVTRRDGQHWAFGTAVVLAPRAEHAHPVGSIFIARAEAGGWRVAFDGESAFGELTAQSPIVTAQEKETFTAAPSVMYAGGDYRTGMALPWANGQSWTMTSGPHGWGGYESPWSSADFAGGDQVVRAVRSGNAYTMCRGWIRVIHDRGYSTDYYHLWSNISVNGSWVGTGAYLGYTGTDVTCGGAASGRHVHFGLRQNGVYVPLAGHSLGKWVFENGYSAYQGGARNGSTFRGPGSSLYNSGGLGFNQGIVDPNGGSSLNKRSGPGTGYAVVGSVPSGYTVTVSCSAYGTSHTGRYGTTALWDRLSDGTWISDAYLWTGINGALSGWC